MIIIFPEPDIRLEMMGMVIIEPVCKLPNKIERFIREYGLQKRRNLLAIKILLIERVGYFELNAG